MAYLIVGGTPKDKEEKLNFLVNDLGTNLNENNPDLFLIKPEKNIGIETIRDVKTFLNKKTWGEKGIKLVVVFDAHTMSPEAQNAFLKTLEEPPGNCQIILITQDRSSLLPTVISRLEVIQLAETEQENFDAIWQEWQNIADKDLAEKIRFADEKSKQAKEWLLALTSALQQELIYSENKDKIACWLRLCQKALTMIGSNVVPARVVDWLMLSI